MIKIKIKTRIKEQNGEDDILSHNIEKIKTAHIKGYDVVSNPISKESDITKKAFTKIGIYPKTDNAYKSIIQQIEPLKTSKISYPIAFGTQGEIYKLSNGTVLKLFTGFYNNDIEWYNKILNNLHSGGASKHTLRIYSHGSFNVKDIQDVEVKRGGTLYYMQMEEIIPFATFLKMSSRSTTKARFQIAQIVNIFSTLKDKFDLSNAIEKTKEQFYKSLKSQDDSILTDKEINQILILVKDILERDNKLGDFHPGNFGIRPNDDKTNPTFVIFDR